MRKPIIAGNWKMYKTFDEAVDFVEAIHQEIPSPDKVDAVICAPALYLPTLVVASEDSSLAIGAQNMHYENDMKNRIKRIEGQLRGIQKMLEDGQNCKDVVTQLSAARSAIDRSIGVIVSTNLVECVREANEKGDKDPEALVNEAVNLLVKSR